MLNFKFKKKLLTTQELLTEINLSLGWLDNQKTLWRKAGNDRLGYGFKKNWD